MTATRRTALKNLALGSGSVLLSPILAKLAAEAAGDEKAIPRRAVFVVQSNGMSPNHLVPVGVKRTQSGGHNSAERVEETKLADHKLPAPLEAFEPFKHRLALVQGLSGRIALSDHSANHGALGAYPANKGPMAQTIDLAMAEALPGLVPHVGLAIANKPTTTLNYQISAAGPGKAVPLQCSPDLAYKSLFGSIAAGSGRSAFDRRTNLLDFMADDVKRARASLAGEERAKLDRYLESFETLRDRQGKIDGIRPALVKHAPKIDPLLAKPHEVNRLTAQFDIAAASLIAGLTNVVTIASGGGGQHYISFPDLGIPVDGHHYGHGGGVDDKKAEDCFVAVRRFHAKLIAGLVKKLESIPEGKGTMMDNTVIVYLSDSGDGHHPQLKEWPVVLIGDLGGRLKTGGRYLAFPKYQAKGHRTTANLFLTLLQAAGRPREQFGVDDPGLKDIDRKGCVGELLA